jgi:hypothetical protein
MIYIHERLRVLNENAMKKVRCLVVSSHASSSAMLVIDGLKFHQRPFQSDDASAGKPRYGQFAIGLAVLRLRLALLDQCPRVLEDLFQPSVREV